VFWVAALFIVSIQGGQKGVTLVHEPHNLPQYQQSLSFCTIASLPLHASVALLGLFPQPVGFLFDHLLIDCRINVQPA